MQRDCEDCRIVCHGCLFVVGRAGAAICVMTSRLLITELDGKGRKIKYFRCEKSKIKNLKMSVCVKFAWRLKYVFCFCHVGICVLVKIALLIEI